MITADRFPVEPWHIRELGIDLTELAQSESVFALSNGHIGVRGNLDEGEPAGLPGTYLNSFYERRPLPYAEAGYGYPESGESVINVTNGKVIRLLIDDEPFDVRYGIVLHHERILDFRAGLLLRVVEWESPSGIRIRVRSTRLVSFTQRAILAIRYQVEAVDRAVRVVLQSELVANERQPQQSADPRVAAVLEKPLIAQEQSVTGNRCLMVHRTKSSDLLMAAAADHVLQAIPETNVHTFGGDDWVRTTAGKRLQPGESVGITKFVAYGWSSQRSLPALRDQVDAALSAVSYDGWDGLVAEQRAFLDNFWDGADVQVDGDPAMQQAVRFGLFHVLQAGARAEQRAIPAKGLTGNGYDGHAFWDTESYVLPVLTATAPDAAADALRWRHSTIGLALERAKTLTLAGAAFAWRTIRGAECSAYWPAGTAAFHINADIAMAAVRYVNWTGDEDFDRDYALPLLVHTARMWWSLGFFGDDHAFHIEGVTGPDEYSAGADDNAYTNLMAARNFACAAAVADRWPDAAAVLDVTDVETQGWRRASGAIAVPYSAEREMFEQDRGSTNHEVWDFAATAADGGYPLLLHAPYFDLYRKQVVKQADLMLAMHWCGESFSLADKAKAFDYYEALTVRDSSLSASTQAIIAAEVGQLQLAHDYLTEAALMDLRDLEHNTRDGLHIAALAGAWLGLVCGFGGMRDHGGQLAFAPRLPPLITGLRFTLRWRGNRITVDISSTEACYSLAAGESGVRPDVTVGLAHHGQRFVLSAQEPVTLAIDEMQPLLRAPTQPAGRTPMPATSGLS